MALTSLLTADVVSPNAIFGIPQWGIFGQGGSPILAADSVFSVEYARDFKISDAPQEQGAFMSYNKVKVPFSAKIGFLAGETRFNFLAEAEPAVASLDLVTVVTPEKSYPSANIVHYGYRREVRRGVTLIIFDVWVEEVRIVGGSTLSNSAQSTNAASAQDNGAVQSMPTTTEPSGAGLGTGLGAPSGATGSSLQTPNIGPAFFTSDNLPTVPNAAGQLTDAQQTTIENQTQAFGGSGTASVSLGPLNSGTPTADASVVIESIDINPSP